MLENSLIFNRLWMHPFSNYLAKVLQSKGQVQGIKNVRMPIIKE